MVKAIHKTSARLSRRCISILILLTFLSSLVVVPVRAQTLPMPGTSVALSPVFQPPVLLGLKVHPENPLLFDFIIDRGVSKLSEDELKFETEKLVKYFLAALTIPDKEVWVNLSPYEKDRIIPDVLGQTIMGKTMLEQDYILKQLASSLTNPEEKLGQEFWAKVKAAVQSKIGSTDVPMNTFNKVWIVPQKAEVLESQGIVIVGDKRLKVMMDQDYVAPKGAESPSSGGTGRAVAQDGISAISSAVFRDTILPNIEKEINEGKNFADVRQIYNSVILAAWYKQALKESLLGKVYADKGKVVGVETNDKEMKQKIYEQYIAAFKKGVYNLIKEESDSATGDMIPRKYFSGGAMLGATRRLLISSKVSSAVVEKNLRASSSISTAVVRLAEDSEPIVASSSAVEPDENLAQGQNFAPVERQFDSDEVIVEMPGASEVLDTLAGEAVTRISQRLAEAKSSVPDAEINRYINEETLRKIIDQIVMVYYFGTQNDRPAYFDMMGLDGNPSEMKASAEIAARVLGFEKALDDGRGHEGYTPELYGYKMSNGKWASYKQLASVLDQEGIRMPDISSSAVIGQMAGVRAQSVLQSFSEAAQDDMRAYVELMARKGEPVIDVAKNSMAKEFVRVLILNMLQHDFSSFENLSFQNWREISDVLHWIPEQMPSPGDFINQLTVLPADGNLKKILSEREFHGKFKTLVLQAVAEIKQFRNAMQQSKKTIFQMLDSETDENWSAIAVLKDFVRREAAVPADSPLFLLLYSNGLIDDKGVPSEEVKAALSFFTLPTTEEIARGERNFKYAASSSVSVLDRIRQLGLRKSETFEFPTGTIVIWKNLRGLPYTFVNVRARPAYKSVVPKIGLLEGDFRNTPISDLDKMLQQQLAGLADAEVKFVGRIPSHQLIIDADGRTIAAINYGRLELPSEKAFGMGTVIVFADHEAVLVPGSSISLDSNETKVKRIQAVQDDFTPKWVDLGQHRVLVKYLGLVRVNDRWKELTQFTALFNNPAGRFQRLAGIAYLEGNQSKTSFLNWEQIKGQQVDVGLSASSSTIDELSPADQARLEELKAQPDLEKYLRGLRDFELTHDAAIVLKTPNSEKHITLPQLQIYRNSPPGIMRSANLVRMIANVIQQVDLPNDIVTLRTVRVLRDQLRTLLDSLGINELAKIIVGSKRAELDNISRGLEAITSPVASELSREYDEKWFVNANRLISMLRFEVLMVGEISAFAEEVKTGKVTTQDAEAKIVEWLRFLPTWAPEGTSRKNISKAMAALARQAVESDPGFISKLENRILVNANGRGAVIKHSKFYLDFMRRLSALKIQPGPVASSAINNEVGGINFDPTNMNLQIKRDGQGVPLPLPQQNLEQINIQGFFPVIINIQPVNSRTLPLLLGRPLGSPEQGDPQEKLSFLN